MLPMNGRIAVVDNVFAEVEPLLNNFAKHQIPYRYYDGNPENLPETDSCNDIRVLIMDLHLETDSAQSDKNLISSLYARISRLISTDNFPYVFIYWSKDSGRYDQAVREMFQNALSDRQPIAIIDAEKSKFWPTSTNPALDIKKLIEEKLMPYPAYQILLEWENCIHESADKTAQNVFLFRKTPPFGNGEKISGDDWSKAGLNVLKRFGVANLGKKRFEKADSKSKVTSVMSVLSTIFTDTLEQKVSDHQVVSFDFSDVQEHDHISVAGINSKLLLEQYSPCILGCSALESESICDRCKIIYLLPGAAVKLLGLQDNLIDKFFDKEKLTQHVLRNNENYESLTKSQKARLCKEYKNSLKEHCIPVEVRIDPNCDHAQSKVIYSRVVEGVLFQEQARDFIDNRSEAVFISPKFEHQGKEYFLVLHYRHLKTVSNLDVNNIDILFRVREQMLAEIQSKAARHISRRGMLSIE